MRLGQDNVRRERGAVSRWLLLGLVAGVMVMHVLGHPGGQGGHLMAMPATPSSPVTLATAGGAAVHTARHAAAAPHAIARVPGMIAVREPGGLDPASVCLAILGSGLLLLLLRQHAALPAARQGGVRARAGVRPSGLSPPRAPALPELSVLRL